MITRYAVIDEFEREQFEKNWQMSYGYGGCFVTTDVEEAIRFIDENISEKDFTYVVEKIDEKGKEVVYKR